LEQLKNNHPSEPTPSQYIPANMSGTNVITFRDFAGIMRRRAPLALLTFAVTCAAAFFVTSRMTKTYEATTRVLLDSTSASAMPSNMLDLMFNGKSSSSGDVEIAKIMSRGFLSEVIRKSGAPVVPEDLKNRVSASLTGGDKILEIKATMKSDPVLTAKVANTVAEVYKEYVVQEADRKVEQSSERLRRAAKRAEQEKDAANRALEAFMARRGISDLKPFYVARAEKTRKVQEQLEDAEKELPLIKKNIALFARQLDTINPVIITATNLNRNGQIDFYQDQLISLDNERKVKLNDFGAESPEIIEIDSRIKSAQESLEALKDNTLRPSGISRVRNPDWSAAYTSFLRAKLELKQTENNIAASRKQLATLRAEQFRIAPERVRYQELQLRVDVTNEAYAKANSALIQLPFQRITTAPSIEILEAARVPTAPISPKPLLNAMLAIFGGLFFGVAVAILAEYFATSPKSYDAGEGLSNPMLPQLPSAPAFATSLPNVAGVPLLARVSLSSGRALPSNAGSGLPVTGTDAATEDAFREIGYLLSHPTEENAKRVPVVLMAGTRTDETTASVAAYLTATLVRDGVRVTLVDGDRVEPRLHHVFGKPDAPG
jgi:uncharacterized protein involved in exopolysaccharide biosynthesis